MAVGSPIAHTTWPESSIATIAIGFRVLMGVAVKYYETDFIMNKSAKHIEDNKKTTAVYQQIYDPLYNLSPELEEKCKQTLLERSNGEPVNEEEVQEKA